MVRPPLSSLPGLIVSFGIAACADSEIAESSSSSIAMDASIHVYPDLGCDPSDPFKFGTHLEIKPIPPEDKEFQLGITLVGAEIASWMEYPLKLVITCSDKSEVTAAPTGYYDYAQRKPIDGNDIALCPKQATLVSAKIIVPCGKNPARV